MRGEPKLTEEAYGHTTGNAFKPVANPRPRTISAAVFGEFAALVGFLDLALSSADLLRFWNLAVCCAGLLGFWILAICCADWLDFWILAICCADWLGFWILAICCADLLGFWVLAIYCADLLGFWILTICCADLLGFWILAISTADLLGFPKLKARPPLVTCRVTHTLGAWDCHALLRGFEPGFSRLRVRCTPAEPRGLSSGAAQRDVPGAVPPPRPPPATPHGHPARGAGVHGHHRQHPAV